MQIWRDFSSLPAEARGAVVALGNFDGLHLGHRAVLAAAREMATAMKAPLAVMTFEPHPRRVFNPSLPIMRIVSLAQRLRLLREAGVNHVYLQHFTTGFAATEASAFIHEILHKQLRARGVVTGDNFLFGHKRGGDSALLQAAGLFDYKAVSASEGEGAGCSSTRIRELLAQGEMEEAARLLTRPYSMIGVVQHGEKRGREWGFPTANIHPGRVFLPRYGVYAVAVSSLQSSVVSRYNAVANFGIRPMYPLEKPLLEVHILGASPDLYGQKLQVDFLRFLRPEQHFVDEAALRAQIAEDCRQAAKNAAFSKF